MNKSHAMTDTAEHQAVHTRRHRCPTCGQVAEFTYLGEQRWPPRVVEATGMPAVTHLWTCGNCHTTLSEPGEER